MSQKKNQFGTFAGVFTPSILTILGVIMFLRAGYVIGQAGIIRTILTLSAVDPNVTTIVEGAIMVGVVIFGALVTTRGRKTT